AIRTQPDHSLCLIVPCCTPVIVSVAEPVGRQLARGGTDGSRSYRVRRALAFECMNDRVSTRVLERRGCVEPEIRNQASSSDPEIVSLADTRATMPSKSRNVHNEIDVGFCS